MILFDKAPITGVRKTSDGYLVASARTARTGIQVYNGAELGRPDLKTVKVLRPAESVFAADSLSTYAFKPLTNNHPSTPVTSANWRDHSVGNVGNEVVRDGDFVAVPLLLMDAKAVADVEAGKSELSAGYSCSLDWTPGIWNGETYDAIQNDIRVNHVAIVDRGRAGSDCRIGDDDKGVKTVATKTITYDGLPIEVTDAAEMLINKLNGKVDVADAARLAAEKQVGELTISVQTKDGEIAALKQQVADAALTPAKLDEAVAARTALVDSVRAILPTFDAKGKTDTEIKRAAVAVRLGDAAAAALSDAALDGAFGVVAASGAQAGTAGIVGTVAPAHVADALSAPVNVADARAKADAARIKAAQEMRDAYRTTSGASA